MAIWHDSYHEPYDQVFREACLSNSGWLMSESARVNFFMLGLFELTVGILTRVQAATRAAFAFDENYHRRNTIMSKLASTCVSTTRGLNFR